MLDAIAIIWLVFSVVAHWASVARGKPIKPSAAGATVNTVVALILLCAILT